MRAYGVISLLLAFAAAQSSSGDSGTGGFIDTRTPTVSAMPSDRTSIDTQVSESASSKPATNSDGTLNSPMASEYPTPRPTMEQLPTKEYSPYPSVSEWPTPRPTYDQWPTKEYSPYPTSDVWPTWDYTPHPTPDEWPTWVYTPHPTPDEWPTWVYTPHPTPDEWPTWDYTPHPTHDDWPTKQPEDTITMRPSFSTKPTEDTFTEKPSLSAKPSMIIDTITMRPSFSTKPTEDTFTEKPSLSAKPTMRPSFSAKPTEDTFTLRPSFSMFPSIRPIPTFLSVSLRPTFMMPTRIPDTGDIRFPPIDNRTKELIAEIIKVREEIKDIMTGIRGDFNVSRAQQFVSEIAKTFSSVSQIATGVRDSIDEVQDSFRRVGALVLNMNRSTVFETRTQNFTLRAAAVDDDKKQEVRTEAGTIQLPILPFKNQSISVVEWKENPFRAISSREIASAVISVMLSDLRSGNETRVSGLVEAINITLPMRDFNFSSFMPMCVYWDKQVNDWRGDGCTVKKISMYTIICGCTHLTDFSIVSVPVDGGTTDNTAVPNSGSSSTNISNLPLIIGGAVGGLIILSIVVAFIVVKVNSKKAKIMTPIPTSNVVNFLHGGAPSVYGGGGGYVIGPFAKSKSQAKISYKPNTIGMIGSMV
jgi:hypothetical protein